MNRVPRRLAYKTLETPNTYFNPELIHLCTLYLCRRFIAISNYYRIMNGSFTRPTERSALAVVKIFFSLPVSLDAFFTGQHSG